MYSSKYTLSPIRASLFITIIRQRHYGPHIGLVYSIHDSTAEVAIQKMIEGAQRMIRVNNSNNSQKEEP
jgi:hypothetical protein